MTMPVVALTPSVLLVTDRCDRCGAQAYVRATLPASELYFCAHHWREHEAKLRSLALEVVDETARLDGTPATAALDER